MYLFYISILLSFVFYNMIIGHDIYIYIFHSLRHCHVQIFIQPGGVLSVIQIVKIIFIMLYLDFWIFYEQGVYQSWQMLNNSLLKVIYFVIDIFFCKENIFYNEKYMSIVLFIFYFLDNNSLSQLLSEWLWNVFNMSVFYLYSYFVNHTVRLYISINRKCFQFDTNISSPLRIVFNFNYTNKGVRS